MAQSSGLMLKPVSSNSPLQPGQAGPGLDPDQPGGQYTAKSGVFVIILLADHHFVKPSGLQPSPGNYRQVLPGSLAVAGTSMTYADINYFLPTPAAAFFAVADAEQHQVRRFLVSLMKEGGQEPVTLEALQRWAGLENPVHARHFVSQLQQRGWLQGLREQPEMPSGALEVELPRLLPALSSEGKVLLADTLGFAVFDQGFDQAMVEELAALSADLASLHGRRSATLSRMSGGNGGAWALVSPRGESQLGFWPLHVGDQRFVLVMGGQPVFDQPTLVDFVILLHRRLMV